MNRTSIVVAVVLATIQSSAVLAQQNLNVNRAQRAGQGQQFNGYAATPWFADPQLQQQLQLNPAQLQALNQAYGNAVNEYNQGVGRIPANAVEARRAERMQRLRERFNQSYNSAVDTAFPNQQSRARFDQLSRQYQGYGAFSDPQLQQQLALTPQQQQQFAGFQNEWQTKLQQLQAMGANNPAAQQQFQQLQQQARQQIGSTLTPQQQQAWQQQVGDAATFPMQSYPGIGATPGQGLPPNAGVNLGPLKGNPGAGGPQGGNVNPGGAVPGAGGVVPKGGAAGGTGGAATGGGAGGGAAGGGGTR